MTSWASGQPRAGRADRAAGAQRSTPRCTALLERDAGDPARDAPLPVHDRAWPSSRGPGAGRLGGGRRLLRPDARIDRADPPSGEVRGRARRRSTSTFPTTSPTSSGDGLDGRRSRTRSASSSSGSGCARPGSRRDDRARPRPPAGAATASPSSRAPTMPGAWSWRPTGTPRPTRPSSCDAVAGGRRRPVQPGAGSRRRAAPAVTILVASDDADAARARCPVRGDRRLTGSARLHRLGRGDPEQAQGVGERDPGGARPGPAEPPTAPVRPGRPRARRGRRRGTWSRARSRRP